MPSVLVLSENVWILAYAHVIPPLVADVIKLHILQKIKVCGKIKAYQVGTVDGFGTFAYADGFSLVYGILAHHIWTFVAARSEAAHPSKKCPCTNINQASSTRRPSIFVENDYFCDTGS